MGAVKNGMRGTIFTIIYIITTVIIPFITFALIMNLGNFGPQGISIGMDRATYQQIIFWILAFGLLISGTAFFAYSSPSQSIRRGIFALIQVILNCLYIWSYKFSGALELEFTLNVGANDGLVAINLEQLIMICLGLYFLTIILKTYDLIDFTLNRKKIQQMRLKGTLKERRTEKPGEIEKKINKKDKKKGDGD